MSTLATTNIKHPSSASNNIVLDSSGNVVLQAGSASTPALQPSGDTNTGIFFPAADTIAFAEGGVEAMRIDSSGRVGIGTTSPQSPLTVGATTDFGAIVKISRTDANFNSGMLVLGNGNSTTNLVGVWRGDANSVSTGGQYLNLGGYDGIVFAAGNAALGAQNRAMTIDTSGRLLVGTTNPAFGDGVAKLIVYGSATVNSFAAQSVAGVVALFNRETNDGDLLEFRQANTTEGSISVSGTTVSYNGAHLSRWSQLPGGAEREEILRGTVLSNIDEMCDWGEEDNEQLNRMKVSDVEGDVNVAGVFQAWDDDDDTYTDDFYCAMTGDFIIRIAEGTPVHRGQLLMSAGDGTAKPQDDDIIRSKTIAKVTSNHVTCTYDDGSYCVPCVLMAC